MPIFDWEMKQGTPEWYSKRGGIPTASCFHLVLTPKKFELASARKKYACRLIAERLMNYQADSLDKIEHIANGKALEPFAVAQLEEIYEIQTRPIGFIRTNDGRYGASPDRVAGVSSDLSSVDTVVEVKCPTITTQMERLIFGHDDAYILQVQGQLWIAEADKAIFYSYSDRMPGYKVETGRQESVIRKLVSALDQFSEELDEWTEIVKRAGSFQPFSEIVTPLDAERSEQVQNSDYDPVWGDVS